MNLWNLVIECVKCVLFGLIDSEGALKDGIMENCREQSIGNYT